MLVADRARIDPHLEARIVRRQPLAYADSSASEDRPPFPRAASGVVFVGEDLVIVQDDASFVAVGRPNAPLRSIALAPGAGGRRRFEERLGNKRDKLDLESCIALDGRVIAFGSGSLPVRECLVVIDPSGRTEPRILDASSLYRSFHQSLAFSGGELNIEGVAIVGDRLRFFQRGNGTAADLAPATADVPLRVVTPWLDGEPIDSPSLEMVRRYDLGVDDGARYGFTDAIGAGDRVLFLASAERSPNALDDGEVVGSRMGVIVGHDVRVVPLLDEASAPARIKAEGLAIDPSNRRRAWVVVDADDPDRPSDLCEIDLAGDWLE